MFHHVFIFSLPERRTLWQQPGPTHPIACTTSPWQNFYPTPTNAENFTTLDIQILSPGKKESFIIALNNLKQKIDAQLGIALGENKNKNLA